MDATMDICGLCVNTMKMDNERSRRLARRNGSEPARHQWVVVTAANAWDVLDGETHYSSSSDTFEAVCDVCTKTELKITPLPRALPRAVAV